MLFMLVTIFPYIFTCLLITTDKSHCIYSKKFSLAKQSMAVAQKLRKCSLCTYIFVCFIQGSEDPEEKKIYSHFV